MSAESLRQRLDDALALCQSGNLPDAEQIYRALTREHDDAPDAWNMLAVVLYQHGKLEEGAQAAERATALRPGIAPYWLMRGNIALARKDWREAQASFWRATEIAPAFAEARYRLALAYHAGYRYAEAIAAYQEALHHAPDVAEIHWQLAEALIAQGRVNEAMRAYQNAFERDPGNALDRRGALEWLGRLHFTSLPRAWHIELERFFTEAKLDVKPYVTAGLKALKTKPGFAKVLAQARSGTTISMDSALMEALSDRLLYALLTECLMADREFEQWLTRLREHLLLSETSRSRIAFDFLCAFALQNFNNEFVFYVSMEERAAVEVLRSEVEARLQSSEAVSGEAIRSALVLACYHRLDTVAGVDRLLEHPGATPALTLLLRRSVIEPRAERALRAQIRSIAETPDPVSREVRGMYEEHPYPRWFALDREPPFTLSEWLERELPALPAPHLADAPRALVAGCGTGRDATWIAANIAGARVLGVDLSLSSLSYARRMAERFAIGNVEFIQGDILGLSTLQERFDLIASTGVLHHMRDPMAGLRSIAGLLKPGGVMKLGFYSSRARVSVTAARQIIADERIAPTEEAMRAFRQRVFSSGKSSLLQELEHSNDFYSMSMCRDLLFHVQEHQYTLPQLGAMLETVDLEFLGFAELTQDTVARYRSLYPQDAAMVDIASWDAYEAQYPNTFSSMFLLWCRRRKTAA